MEASKNADEEFHVPSSSVWHTIREATKDILDKASHLLNTGVTAEKVNSSGPLFQDPAAEGKEEKAAKGWIETFLAKGAEDDPLSDDYLENG